MADEDVRVRQIVREELAARADSVRVSPQTAFARTQSLIRGAARNAIEELSIPGSSSIDCGGKR